MHLLKVDKNNYIGQADPFILKSGNKYYIYTTGHDGIYAYHSSNLFDGWEYYGRVMTMEGHDAFWAPSVIELDGKFYMYNSIEIYNDDPDQGGHRGAMHVSVADNPLGPFTNTKQILHPFSIDSHVVKTDSGLFILYSSNRFEGERIGTCIYVDRLIDPYTVEGNPVLLIEPTLDEDIYRRDRYKKGQHWHTIEGAYYFKEGEWQYIMYSGNCYEQPTYYVGYARAKTEETDLRKIKFEKYPDDNTYSPVLAANEFEEGTGHHSMIKEDGQWYAIYHARDYDDGLNANAFDARNARICKLNVNDGIITAERYENRI
ncbi:MAG: glycoside hydrolase family 43 protein [Eubacterium sp.]